MNKFIFLAALAALAIWHTSILGFSPEAPATNRVAGNLPAGIPLGQSAHQNANVVGPGDVSIEGSGLASGVAAVAATKLGRTPDGVVVSLPLSPVWGFPVRDPLISEPTRNLCRVHPGQANRQIEPSVIRMTKAVAAKPAPTVAPKVSVVKKSVFTFKSRPVIAPKGLQTANYGGTVNMQGTESGHEFNRVEKTVILEAVDGKNKPFVLTKDYNIMPGGRGANTFVQDYNAWTGAGLTEDDLYESFDGEANKGQALVVEVGHRKTGNEWEAYIMAFHPEGYTGETVEA